jgi:hypothetical protein
MQTGHPNNHEYQIGKAWSTHPMIGNAAGTKVQGAFPTISSPFMRKRAMDVHMHG